MDLNILRIGVTVLSFAAFIGIAAFAWSRRNQAGFTEAAQLPFADAWPTEDQNPARTRP